MYNIAVIDIGTNSTRMMMCNMKNNQILEKTKELRTTRLGHKLYQTGIMQKDRIVATCDAIVDYVQIAKLNGIENISIFATNAMRIAQNSDELIELVLKKTGIKINIISGIQEAKIGYMGAVDVLNSKNPVKAMIIDIGGGSTEIIAGSDVNIENSKSFEIGVVRLTEKFDISGDFNFADEKKYENYLKSIADACVYTDELIEINSIFKNFMSNNFVLVGVAGTITTLVQIKNQIENYRPELIHSTVLKMDDLKAMLKLIANKSLEDRKNVIGLDFKRADVIVAGIIILISIMRKIGKEEILVSDSDNLEGYLYDRAFGEDRA